MPPDVERGVERAVQFPRGMCHLSLDYPLLLLLSLLFVVKTYSILNEDTYICGY
jgi:hypothetical protein